MESAPSPSQIPEGLDKNNVLVAESDVKAAVQAMYETFRAHEGRDVLVGNAYDPPTNERIRSIHKLMLQDREQLMVESLHQVSHTISDDEYNALARRHCADYEPSDVVDVENCSEGDDEDDLEDEYDDHELVDHFAKQKVDALRKQVLEKARQVQAKRATILHRATEVARDATERLVKHTKTTASATSEDDVDGVAEMVQQKVSSLRESVAQLKQQLLTSEQQLEHQLERLTSTVAVIEKHPVGGGNGGGGGGADADRTKNPTRKVDELMRTNFSADASPNDENVAWDPAERLAQFLRH